MNSYELVVCTTSQKQRTSLQKWEQDPGQRTGLKAACASRGSLSHRRRLASGSWLYSCVWVEFCLLSAKQPMPAACRVKHPSWAVTSSHSSIRYPYSSTQARNLGTTPWQVRSVWLTQLLQSCGYSLYQGKRKKNCVLRAEEDKKSKEVAKSELSKQAIIYRPQNQC